MATAQPGALWAKEKVFGWRLHLVCTPAGVPVRFSILPASLHDLTPIHELTYGLPSGARVVGDKGSTSAADQATIVDETGVRLVPSRKATMKPHAWFLDELELREYRQGIETVNSQLERMGIQQLHVRTNAGHELKLHASLLALLCTNFD